MGALVINMSHSVIAYTLIISLIMKKVLALTYVKISNDLCLCD